MDRKLSGRTVFITGASRGIGKAIALKCARDGANIVIAAKTDQPHPKLHGTIYTAAKEVEQVGGKALPCIVDVRNEEQIKAAVKAAVNEFGGIDIVVNNASAISRTSVEETEMKRYDLMQNINPRGTFLVTKECLPYLKRSSHAHVLTMSPPIRLNPFQMAGNLAYIISKYSMSMCTLGMADEFGRYNISVNSLWPRTLVWTAAVNMLHGADSANYSRSPEVMADAAYAILCQEPEKKVTGNCFIDEDVLTRFGVTNFDQYAMNPAFKSEITIISESSKI